MSNIYITKIVVLVSEPVRGRSRATELPCYFLSPACVGGPGQEILKRRSSVSVHHV